MIHRKESTTVTTIGSIPLNASDPPASGSNTPESKCKDGEFGSDEFKEIKTYPFAVVLRIRVLQIVCGISSMVMGTVGFIEEKGQVNLGLGIPAGAATVLAAGASIHTSRGFGGYKPSSCTPGSLLSHLRFLGPSVSIAGPLTFAWATAFILHATLCILSFKTLIKEQWITVYQDKTYEYEMSEAADEEWNTRALAAIILILSVITILSTLTLLRIDCLYDPD